MSADAMTNAAPRRSRRPARDLRAAAWRAALPLAISCIAGSLVSWPGAGPGAVTAAPSITPIQQAFGQLPLYFIENRGQMDARVAYYVQGRDTSVYFTGGGVTLTQAGADQRWTVKLDFVGANAVAPVGEVQTAAAVSYFKGRPQEWKTELKTYGSIAYRNLWPGVDLIYSGTVNRLKYDYVLQPGADVAQIRMRYRGATDVRINQDGALEVRTPAGGFSDDTPFVYQDIDGRRVEIDSAYVLYGDGEYGFRVGDYDRTRPLILDPAVLVYCGFIGGSANEGTTLGIASSGIAVDASGNVYVTGAIESSGSDFPASVGPDLTANGNVDTFIAKVNASGTGLVYAGYLGGSGYEWGYDVAVDAAGNAYVTGFVNSNDAETYPDFPAIVGPDLTFNGFGDAFIAKVNAAGTGLVYSGFIGGLSNDDATGIAVDADGNAYVVGNTGSHEVWGEFPAVVGPDLTLNGSTDAFVAKVNATGSALVYAGYIGGEGTDIGRGIAVDSAGNAYVAGGSNSTGGIANWFAFVTKVDAAGALAYQFQIQGEHSDEANAIAVDMAGNAYITGYTRSDQASFPVAGGPDLTFNSGAFGADAFVAKINAAGNALVYAGYIGGAGYDEGHGIAVDGAGNAYIAGRTHSTEATFPVADGPDLTFNNPATPDIYPDAFVAKVNAAGTALSYAGYIGGSFDDQATAIAVDTAGAAYVVGITTSTEADFPVTVGPDLTFNGFYDLFVAKISSSSDVPSDNVEFIGTPSTTIECPPGLGVVTGNLNISNNGQALTILCPAVHDVGGNLSVLDNAAMETLAMGGVQHVGGNLAVIGNTAALTIDLGNVQDVGGDLTIINNGDATVDLGAVEDVGGNLTVESSGTGNFDADACVQGISDFDLAGYASLSAATAMGGTTVTMEDGSIMTIELQPGTFPSCVQFSIARVDTTAETGEDAEGNEATLDPVLAFQFAFTVPTLGLPAELTFDIVLATLDPTRQAELLAAVASGNATLVTKGDNLGAVFTAFEVCAAGEPATVDGCVAVQTLDANGTPTAGTPEIIRFTGVVGHFSTWAVAIVTPATNVAFNGLLQPYPEPPHTATPTFKRGSVVPLKFNWMNRDGVVIDSAASSPSMTIYPGTCSGEPTTTPIATDDAGQSDGFRYDTATKTWVFAWSTKPLPAGCYWIQVQSGNSVFPAPSGRFPVALR